VASTDITLADLLLLELRYSSWIVVVVMLLLELAEPVADELPEEEDDAADADLPLSELGIDVIMAEVAVHEDVADPEVADADAPSLSFDGTSI
jgi:hypothetical protein